MDNSSEFFDITSTQVPADCSRELVCSSETGYSEIWRFDRGGRFRVLKCLKEEYRGNRLYERLLQKEFEIGYSLAHEGICEYYSFIIDSEFGSCIEMEWVDGRTLDRFLAERKWERSVYDKIIGEICSALSYMHAKQVLHRDLKPSNILVTYNGNNVKLIDFGLSDNDSSSILKMAAGTLSYAAPEVRDGDRASIRSDLYSLGMVMSLFPVRKYSRIVRRLISMRPDSRYSSVREVEKALKTNMPVIAGALFMLFVALMALVPIFEKRTEESSFQTMPLTDTHISVPDTVVVPDELKDTMRSDLSGLNNEPSTTRSVSSKKSPASVRKDTISSTTDQVLIDELFRQATELFE